MPRKSSKTDVVAFKIEKELADFLNQLPNKSEFIRKSIAAQMSTVCPLCNGAGQVSRWMHDHYQEILTSWESRHCDGCGDSLSLPRDSGDLKPDDQARLEQFFHGGPLYCDPCYEKAAPCGDCGMHIAKDKVKQHHRVHEGVMTSEVK